MTSSSSERDPVERLADEFLARFRRGEQPALTEYTERFPEWAERIRKVFPALVLMEGVRPEAGEATGAEGGVAVADARRLERLGDYRLLREVGRGGMGIVYEAEQLSLGRHVALKVLPSPALLDARHLGRFQREAKAAAHLHHTNIVPVYGVGEDQGLHYYVMQFIQGLGLDDVLAELRRLRRVKPAPGTSDTGTDRATPSGPGKEVSAAQVAQALLTGEFTPGHDPARGGRPLVDPSPGPQTDVPRAPVPSSAVHLPGQSEGSSLSESGRPYWQGVARVGIQVAEALAYAHGQGILHRDIKPSNLLLDTQGTVWVTDFGLAKAAGSEDLTHPGDIVGTIRYLAPERFEARADARSDVYALGLTLYELLTLRPAFNETDRSKLVAQVLHAEPPRPRQVQPEVPRNLETVVLKALERDPTRRYQTAAELADDLKRFVAGEPIRARPVSTGQRVLLWAKRRPAAAALLGVSVVTAMALVGVVVGFLYNRELQKKNDEIHQALQREGTARQQAEQAQAAETEQRHKAETASYFHRILVAEREWQAHNVGQTVRLLQACPDPLHGWEWKYLNRLCHLDLGTLRGHSQVVNGVAFSPDGKYLASASGSGEVGTAAGQVILWDALTGQLVHRLGGHALPVLSLAFSPDGQHLASAGGHWDAAGPGEVKLWEVATGQEARSLQDLRDNVLSLAFSPDGQHLAVATGSGRWRSPMPREVSLWQVHTGQKVRTLAKKTGLFLSLAFSPDGQLLAGGGTSAPQVNWSVAPGFVRVWDVQSGQEAASFKSAVVRRVAFSPEGRLLAAAGTDQTIKVWNPRSGQEVHTLRGHTGPVTGLAFSPQGGPSLVSGSEDGTLRIWDVATGQERRLLRGHTAAVQDVALAPDGRRLASASHDETVKLWDAAEDQGPFTLRSHRNRINAVAFSPDGSRLIAAGGDGARVWDPTSGELLLTYMRHRSILTAVQVFQTPTGPRVVSAGLDRTVHIWDPVTGKQSLVFQEHAKGGRDGGYGVQGLALSADGQLCASVGEGEKPETGEVWVWKTATGEKVWHRGGIAGGLQGVAFSPDGRRLAMSGGDPTIRVWDLGTGQELFACRGHRADVSGVVFSPDGKCLASNSTDRTVRVWDARTGQELLTLSGHRGCVQRLSFTPDGSRLVTASEDATLKVWDARTGAELLTLRGHDKYVWALDVSPDGQRLASGDSDGILKIWETTPPTPELRLRRQAGAQLNHLAWEGLLPDEIRARLRNDRSLSEPVRQQALELAQRYPGDAVWLTGAAGRVVSKPGADAAVYGLALRRVEAAGRLGAAESSSTQLSPLYLSTLGRAQYRVGNYEAALATLAEYERLWKGTSPVPLGFSAMAHHQLGRKDQVRDTLDRLRKYIQARGLEQNASAQALLREVEELLYGPANTTKP
jgi:WD40 repeat protein/serine/threonine protein kinase